MKYKFLPLDEDDLVECSQLYINTFNNEPWNENWNMEDAFNRLSNFLSPTYSIGFKAVKKNLIQGFLVGEIEQWRGSQNFYLKEMCVSKEFQRSGLGRKLMLALQNKLYRLGISRIYLITQRETVPEIFYKSEGFETNGSLIISVFQKSCLFAQITIIQGFKMYL
jgi:ribosomal protein S18 acetylase RimI-like enzyme